MANLGDVDRQTVAGATSTGTGTGAAFGGISTQIAGATLVERTGRESTSVPMTPIWPPLRWASAPSAF